MELSIVLEQRFWRTPDSRVWTDGPLHADFWRRYLRDFESLTVVARVHDCSAVPAGFRQVTSSKVRVHAIPAYVGTWQFLLQHRSVKHSLKAALESAKGALILRSPGLLSAMAAELLLSEPGSPKSGSTMTRWKNRSLPLKALLGSIDAHTPQSSQNSTPFGVEVVGDPLDVFAPKALSHPLRPFFRRYFSKKQRQLCQNASAALYVSSHQLPQRYPSPALVRIASNVELTPESFAKGPRLWKAQKEHEERRTQEDLALRERRKTEEQFKQDDLRIREAGNAPGQFAQYDRRIKKARDWQEQIPQEDRMVLDARDAPGNLAQDDLTDREVRDAPGDLAQDDRTIREVRDAPGNLAQDDRTVREARDAPGNLAHDDLTIRRFQAAESQMTQDVLKPRGDQNTQAQTAHPIQAQTDQNTQDISGVADNQKHDEQPQFGQDSLRIRDEQMSQKALSEPQSQKLEKAQKGLVSATPSNASPCFRLIFVGTLEQLYKGPDVLLKAMARCREQEIHLQATLVGDGRRRRELERLGKKLKLSGNLSFTGFLPSAEAVRAQLAQADAFVLPSRTEGLPRAMLEAMAQGLPCVGSSAGGIPELLPPEAMCAPGDDAALAELLSRLVKDEDFRCRLATHAFSTAQRYSEDILDLRRRDFYQAVIAATRERR